MADSTVEVAAVRAFRRTLQGVEAAEWVGAGCAWVGVAAAAAVVSAGAAWLHPVASVLGFGVLAVGALGLRRVATHRWERAAPLLDGFTDPVVPTWAVPNRIPRGEREEGGVLRVWRVFGVAVPDGHRITAEVAVERPMGEVWFVCWPAAARIPQEARKLDLVFEPVVPGMLVASVDATAAAQTLRDSVVVDLIVELVGEHGELSVYPFGAWWRTKEPATKVSMRAAEARLLQLAEALSASR